jgi:hypothetical protein
LTRVNAGSRCKIRARPALTAIYAVDAGIAVRLPGLPAFTRPRERR